MRGLVAQRLKADMDTQLSRGEDSSALTQHTGVCVILTKVVYLARLYNLLLGWHWVNTLRILYAAHTTLHQIIPRFPCPRYLTPPADPRDP